jgi:hypothetical protein
VLTSISFLLFAGVVSKDNVNLRYGCLAPSLFSVERMRVLEARVVTSMEVYTSRQKQPEGWGAFTVRWYNYIAWRVHKEGRSDPTGVLPTRKAGVLKRRVVVEEVSSVLLRLFPDFARFG